MGKANQSQTESCEVFHNSEHSYEQYLSICILYFFLIRIPQLSLNTELSNTANFCRNSKGIQFGKLVYNIFVIYDFLLLSTFFAYFNIYQVTL